MGKQRAGYDPVKEQRYRKINAPYKRTPDGKFITDEFSMNEFEELLDHPWHWYEKVDGMNIRIRRTEDGIVFGGKTDRAQIPGQLRLFLEGMIERNRGTLMSLEPGTCLYGEGFGGKIQKGSDYGEQRFILFDVLAPDPLTLGTTNYWWSDVLIPGFARKLGIESVGYYGVATLREAMEIARTNPPKSFLKDGLPEGAVGQPSGPRGQHKDRFGNPVITKVTLRDFYGK